MTEVDDGDLRGGGAFGRGAPEIELLDVADIVTGISVSLAHAARRAGVVVLAAARVGCGHRDFGEIVIGAGGPGRQRNIDNLIIHENLAADRADRRLARAKTAGQARDIHVIGARLQCGEGSGGR